MRSLKKNHVIIGRNVHLGRSIQLDDFVVIGYQNKDTSNSTTIGSHSVIRSHSIVYAGNQIGDNFITGHNVLIREGNTIGNNVSVGSHSVVEGKCRIANNVKIHTNVYLGEDTEIEEGSWIGPGCITLLTPHPRCIHQEKCNRGPRIGKNVIVGAGAIIMPRVNICEGAMIGAGSVVTRDVPAGTVVAGVPSKAINVLANVSCPIGKRYKKKSN